MRTHPNASLMEVASTSGNLKVQAGRTTLGSSWRYVTRTLLILLIGLSEGSSRAVMFDLTSVLDSA